MCQLHAEHGVRWCEVSFVLGQVKLHYILNTVHTKHAEVIRRSMMSSNETGIGFRFIVAPVVNPRGQCTISTCPVVVRDEVEVLVEGSLRLFVDDTEDLVNSRYPYISIRT